MARWLSNVVLGLICVAVALTSTASTQETNPTFTITTQGSLVQSAVYGLPVCAYCNCGTGCNWFNNYVCPNNPAAGADDNQERWGTCSLDIGCPCFNQSGAGFQGVVNLPVTANQADGSVVGRFTHYNNPTRGTPPTQMRLAIQVSSPAFPQPVVVVAPLNYLETTNTATVAGCDQSIQESKIPCDDMFSFQVLNDITTFAANNTLYELAINGFVKNGSLGSPISKLVTTEGQTTVALVYVTINASCASSLCGPNEVPRGLPYCDCLCQLNSSTCSAALGSNWGVPTNGDCACECALSTCSVAGQTVNPDTCTCGCNITTSYCQSLSADLEASTTECGCACSKQAQVECYQQQPFYRSVQTNGTCSCACAVTDQMCADWYKNSSYVVDTSVSCGCIVKTPSGGDGGNQGDGGHQPGQGGWIGIGIGLGCVFGIGFAFFGGALFFLVKCGVIGAHGGGYRPF